VKKKKRGKKVASEQGKLAVLTCFREEEEGRENSGDCEVNVRRKGGGEVRISRRCPKKKKKGGKTQGAGRELIYQVGW